MAVEGEQCHRIGLRVPAVDVLGRSGVAVRPVEAPGAGPLERSEEVQVEAGWREGAVVAEGEWGGECPADQQRAEEAVEGAMGEAVEGYC